MLGGLTRSHFPFSLFFFPICYLLLACLLPSFLQVQFYFAASSGDLFEQDEMGLHIDALALLLNNFSGSCIKCCIVLCLPEGHPTVAGALGVCKTEWPNQRWARSPEGSPAYLGDHCFVSSTYGLWRCEWFRVIFARTHLITKGTLRFGSSKTVCQLCLSSAWDWV